MGQLLAVEDGVQRAPIVQRQAQWARFVLRQRFLGRPCRRQQRTLRTGCQRLHAGDAVLRAKPLGDHTVEVVTA